jgi:hypothetical protein
MIEAELVPQCEIFRQSVMASIEQMPITPTQKYLFLLKLQTFYLQMLQELNTNLVVSAVTENSNNQVMSA